MIKAILFDFDGVLTTDATGSTSICNYISKYTGISVDVVRDEYYKYSDGLLYGNITHTDIWQEFMKNIFTISIVGRLNYKMNLFNAEIFEHLRVKGMM